MRFMGVLLGKKKTQSIKRRALRKTGEPRRARREGQPEMQPVGRHEAASSARGKYKGSSPSMVRKQARRSIYASVDADATRAARRYRRKVGASGSPVLASSQSTAALAGLRRLEALRRGTGAPLDVTTAPLSAAPDDALLATRTLLRHAPPTLASKGPLATTLARGPARGELKEAFEKKQSEERARYSVYDDPPSRSKRGSRRVSIAGAPHSGAGKRRTPSTRARTPSSRGASRSSRPSTATVPEDAELPPQAWPFAKDSTEFVGGDAADPEDRKRSLLSRAGSITRAEMRAARGEAPPPEVQRALQAPGAGVARLERKIFVIGGDQLPSVEGWRRGPPEHYLKNCDEYSLIPEPKMMQLIQSLSKAARPELDLKDQRIGDDHALAVMDAMACSDPVVCNVRNCRLTARGVKAVSDALAAHCTRLEEFDVSDNECRRPKAAKALALLLDAKGCDTLRKLSVSHCGLATASALVMTSEWSRRVQSRRALKHLVELHLAKNDLGIAAETLGGLLGPNGAFPALRLLDLAWTGLHGAGALAVATGLLQSQVQRCDLSWNAVRGDDHECIAALAESLERAPKLWHVNLSFNGMVPSDLRRLEAGARRSQTLAALHLGGNAVQAILDERDAWLRKMATRRQAMLNKNSEALAQKLSQIGKQGKLLERGRDVLAMEDPRDSKESNSLGDALATDSAPSPFLVDGEDGVEDDQYLYTRIVGTKDVPQSLEWHRSNKCWICEKWHEIRFAWTPGRSDADVQPASRALISKPDLHVSCRCAFDGWRPHVCEKVKKSHQVWLLVPPGDRQYTFELAAGSTKVTEAASDAGREVLHKKNLEAALWDGAFAKDHDEDKGLITNVHTVPCGDWADVQFVPIPEKQAVAIKRKPKEPWTWQKSLFAPAYEGDFERPFEKDWELAKCDKLVGDDNGATKAYVKANYGEFLSVFKLFCCNSKALFTLGWNDFTEFVVHADLEVKRKADADMAFFGCCTTGIKSQHLNPKKSLCRFQFLDAGMKLSHIKWLRTKEVATALECAQKLVERVAPLVPSREESDEFHERVWREDVEDAIKHDLDNLKRAFKTHSGREDALSKHKLCSFAEWQEMCEKLHFVDPAVGFTERHVNLCFLRATKTPDDELCDEHAPHRKLDWVHWVEAVLRVGDTLSEHAACDLEPHDACIRLFERVAYEYPSGAETRRRAKLAAELDRARQEEAAAEKRKPSLEERAAKPKLSAVLKGARGLGAFIKKPK